MRSVIYSYRIAKPSGYHRDEVTLKASLPTRAKEWLSSVTLKPSLLSVVEECTARQTCNSATGNEEMFAFRCLLYAKCVDITSRRSWSGRDMGALSRLHPTSRDSPILFYIYCLGICEAQLFNHFIKYSCQRLII